MIHRSRRKSWLLAGAMLALALPQVATARGDHGGSGSHSGGGGGSHWSGGGGSRTGGGDRSHAGARGGSQGRSERSSPHGKYSARDFERRDHRGQVRYDGGRTRHDRNPSGRDRGHDRYYARSHPRGAHHYYPRYGRHVYQLPQHCVTITVGGHSHYYYHGVWYRPWGFGLGYVVVAAPIGAVVSVLPPFYTTVWLSDVPYYYANYTYYRWSPVHDGYLVVEDPGVGVDEAGSDELFVYPNKGQSEQQQADDRYACHRWAVDETGYDPSLVDPADDESALAGLRADYQRAMSACLEGRDYTVK